MMNRKTSSFSLLISLVFLLLCLGPMGCHSGSDTRGHPPASEVFSGIPIDNEMTFVSLEGRVEVIRDEWGVPHIYGIDGNPGDAMFVQGYVTASDRLWEMDLIRKFAEGKLTELLGLLMPFVLAQDVYSRTIFTTPRGNRIEDELADHLRDKAPEIYAMLVRYSDGVNAFLEDLKAGRNGAELPSEFRWLLFKPASIAPWRPQDSLAIGRYQQWDLSESMGSDLRNLEKSTALLEAEAEGRIPAGTYLDTIRSVPIEPTYVLPGYYERAAAKGGPGSDGAGSGSGPAGRELLQGIDRERLGRMAEAYEKIAGRRMEKGSNNWVLSGAKTRSGYPLIADDPHLALYCPPIFYELHMDDKTFLGGNVSFGGVNFPGLPGAIIGHSDRVGWAVTYVGYDVLDIYVEDVATPPDFPASPRTVRFRGEDVEVVTIMEDFCIRGEADPIRLPIEIVPHHGPQLPDPDPLDDVTGLPSVENMTMRWTGAEPTLEMITVDKLSTLQDMDDFFDALSTFDVGAQNFMAASVDGEIGFYPHAKVPLRDPRALTADMPPWMPLPGTGACEWLTNASGAVRFIPDGELPQARNPGSGVIVTANNDQVGVTADNDPLDDAHYLYRQAAMGTRAGRITELVDEAVASGGMSFEEMKAIQQDTVSLTARRLVPVLQNALDDVLTGGGGSDPRLAEVRVRLADWGLAHPTGTDVAGFRASPPTAEEIDESVGATLFNAWLVRFIHGIFDDEYAEAGLSSLYIADAIRAVVHLLEDADKPGPDFKVNTLDPAIGESRLFDDVTTPTIETATDIMIAAMIDTLDFLEAALGTPTMGAWKWGLLHRTYYYHTLFDQAGLPLFNLPSTPLADGCTAYPAPGGYGTPNPGSYWGRDEEDFYFFSGPVVRFVIRMEPDNVTMESVLPGGQRGVYRVPAAIDPDDHFGDQTGLWLTGGYKPFHFYLDDVVENAEERWSFGPEE